MASRFEKLYPYAPVWLQNAGISIFGLGWRSERLGGDFARYVQGFRERDRCAPDAMRAYVERELQRVLVHAFEQVPYYREAWAKLGVTTEDLRCMTPEDLPKLPITPKDALRADSTAFIADDYRGSRDLRRYGTCGTTGTPIGIYVTPDTRRRSTAAREVRSYGWAGATILGSRSMMGARLVVPAASARPPFHRYNIIERQVYMSGFHISAENVKYYVDALNHHRPAVMTGYAHAHYILAKTMLAAGLRLGYEPKAVIMGSEKITDEMRSAMQEAFRARVYEEYGSVENVAVATECEAGSLHVSPDLGVCEITDDDGRPVPPDEQGRIVGTTLINAAQPLIRYDIGDLAIRSSAKCSCGRDHLPVLREIVGREEEAVLSADGREMVRCVSVFKDLPGLLEGQIIQEHVDAFRVLVVTQPGFGEAEESAIRHRFALRVGEVRVTIERVPSIPRTERGKFRGVVNRIPPEERARN